MGRRGKEKIFIKSAASCLALCVSLSCSYVFGGTSCLDDLGSGFLSRGAHQHCLCTSIEGGKKKTKELAAGMAIQGMFL